MDDLRGRIEQTVPELANCIGSASEFADLVARNQLAQRSPAAWVLPGSLSGGAADAISGFFKQSIRETISVVLALRVAADPTGARALTEITPLVRSVITAVCGWGPDDSPGVFQLAAGELVGVAGGVLVYQLDFSLPDQLRITP